METMIDYRKNALTILVHITEAGKSGMQRIIWPPMFRGIEQPDEFHPSQALIKLIEKFKSKHPQPFGDLKEIQEKYQVNSEAMDFFEKPLWASMKGMVCRTTKPPRDLEKELGEVEHFKIGLNFTEKQCEEESVRRFQTYIKEKARCDKEEKQLTIAYRSWLAKKDGSKVEQHVGGWGNIGDSISSKEVPYLRRNEIISFVPLAGYDIRNEFDMKSHNRNAFLATYENGLKGTAVLIAYGRLITTKKNLEQIDEVVKQLKLFEGEYIKGMLDRTTFAQMVDESRPEKKV